MRERRWQIREHDAWDQHCQPDEAEAVQDEQRPQCFGPFPEAEFRPDISSGDYPPRDEAECDAHEKPDHLLWHDECLLFRIPAIDMANVSRNATRSALDLLRGEGGRVALGARD